MKKRVVAYLKGGLGNQCFIYATARALALRTGADLAFNLDYFLEDKIYKRKFELDKFAIKGDVLPLDGMLTRKYAIIRYGFVSRILKATRIGNFQCDKHPRRYRPMPTEWDGDLLIDGYWHSHAYFDDAWDELIEDFKLIDGTVLYGDDTYHAIRDTENSVFCHMRSYKEVPGYADGGMALKVGYYEMAIRAVVERLGARNMTLFLFSDDLDWATARLKPIVASLGLNVVPVKRVLGFDNQIRDFVLLGSCRHGIVANSSFSRFAGMLGQQASRKIGREDGVFVRSNCVLPDYCPADWIVIDKGV